MTVHNHTYRIYLQCGNDTVHVLYTRTYIASSQVLYYVYTRVFAHKRLNIFRKLDAKLRNGRITRCTQVSCNHSICIQAKTDMHSLLWNVKKKIYSCSFALVTILCHRARGVNVCLITLFAPWLLNFTWAYTSRTESSGLCYCALATARIANTD